MQAIQLQSQWPKAAVFDCDGLLLESERAWHRAYAAALADSGRVLTDDLGRRLNGASVAAAAGVLEVDEHLLRAELERAFRSERVEPRPGARDLLARIAGRLPLAVATNAPASLVRDALRDVDLLDYFDVVVSAETGRRYKPSPAVYLEACVALGVDPSDAIALEDSEAGAAAARRASMVVIHVPSQRGSSADADLRVARLDDPAVFAQFGVDESRRDGLAGARTELRHAVETILSDVAIDAASEPDLNRLAGSLRMCLVNWRRQLPRGRSSTTSPPDASTE